jgi:hypothetical protein
MPFHILSRSRSCNARVSQAVLIASTLVGSWLAMQGVHEIGHVLGAWVSGGQVERVVWHPLRISRTDLAANPSPLLVAWAGPIFGIALPLLLWAIVSAAKLPIAFVFRFFAGFCLLANGLYIACGSVGRVGDCGEMLRHGSPMWQLWLFGAVTAPWGLWLWHRQGPHFGLGSSASQISPRVAFGALGVCLTLLTIGFLVGGR